MHDGMPYGRNQGQGQGHSREVDRQSPTGLIFCYSASSVETPRVERMYFNASQIFLIIIFQCFDAVCTWYIKIFLLH